MSESDLDTLSNALAEHAKRPETTIVWRVQTKAEELPSNTPLNLPDNHQVD